MREDEVEALLKLDGAQLQVYSKESPTGSNKTYMASVQLAVSALHNPNELKHFARVGATREEAVHSVWKIYKQFMEGTQEDKRDVTWFFTEAEANVELKLYTGEANEEREQRRIFWTTHFSG